MSLVPGPVRAVQWVGALAAAAGLALGLAGCVHTGGPDMSKAPPKVVNDGRDIKTASDQTEADRRAKVRMELASAYFARGQATDALDEVKQALASKPDNAQAYGLRGLIYASLDDPKTAEESFRRARELAPHDGDLMHNYAWFECQQRRYADADAEFAAALAEPKYEGQSRTLLARGVCQARAGDLGTAEKTLSHAYELDPANPTTAVNLSEVLYKRGEYDRARFYIRRVNVRDELVSAQTLWLAARIEHRLRQDDQVQELGSRLHARFPQASETLAFDRGRFDD
jgi:type IV pilus assembly protein PilF